MQDHAYRTSREGATVGTCEAPRRDERGGHGRSWALKLAHPMLQWCKSLQLCLFATLWTAACQAPLFMGFSRQEYWSGLPCPPPGDLPDPGIGPGSHVSCIGRRVLYHSCHLGNHYTPSVQFSSVAQSCPTLCNPMNHSTPGLPVHHQLPEFTQTHVHRVSDAIQPSHPQSSPSPPAPNPSQHQSLFQ